MSRLGRQTGLIAYDTEANIRRREEGRKPVLRILRARTVLYGVLVAGVGGFMLYSLATRSFTGLSVLHDRNPLFVALSDGAIRNGYTVRVVNKRPAARHLALSVDGLPDARVEVVGGTPDDLPVPSDATQEFRVLVFAPSGARLAPSLPITFRIADLTSDEGAAASDHFKAP